MTLAVKVALNPNTTNQPTLCLSSFISVYLSLLPVLHLSDTQEDD